MARHLYHCPLRWSDMDAFGHVNNVVFVRYLEEARIDFMFQPAGAEDGGGIGFSRGTVVVHHDIDYVRPLVHRHEPVVIEMWVTLITAARVGIAYEVRDTVENGATVYARASTVVVPYDLEAQRPRRLSPEERAFLEQYLDDGGNDDPSGPGSGSGTGRGTPSGPEAGSDAGHGTGTGTGREAVAA